MQKSSVQNYPRENPILGRPGPLREWPPLAALRIPAPLYLRSSVAIGLAALALIMLATSQSMAQDVSSFGPVPHRDALPWWPTSQPSQAKPGKLNEGNEGEMFVFSALAGGGYWLICEAMFDPEEDEDGDSTEENHCLVEGALFAGVVFLIALYIDAGGDLDDIVPSPFEPFARPGIRGRGLEVGVQLRFRFANVSPPYK